jgi:hypothetical protein
MIAARNYFFVRFFYIERSTWLTYLVWMIWKRRRNLRLSALNRGWNDYMLLWYVSLPFSDRHFSMLLWHVSLLFSYQVIVSCSPSFICSISRIYARLLDWTWAGTREQSCWTNNHMVNRRSPPKTPSSDSRCSKLHPLYNTCIYICAIKVLCVYPLFCRTVFGFCIRILHQFWGITVPFWRQTPWNLSAYAKQW